MLGKRVRVNLTIDAEVVEKAKEIGLNISKVAENALNRSIRALEQVEDQTEVKNNSESRQKRARWDSNPRSPAPEAGALSTLLRALATTRQKTHD